MKYGHKYSYSRKRNNKKIFMRIFFVVLLILLLFLIIFTVSSIVRTNKKRDLEYTKTNNKLIDLFNNKNYLNAIKKSDIVLKKSPFNEDGLRYRGFSYYYLGEEETNILKKEKYLTLAKIDLRKYMQITGTKKYLSDIYFYLGKIYFYLGEPYYNLSLKFTNLALQFNNKKKGVYYLLGILKSNRGEYDDALKYFLNATRIQENDTVLLAIAVTYFKNNKYEEAIKYFKKIIEVSIDNLIKEKSYFYLGKISYEKKEYDKALDYFNSVLQLNDNNASAYFYRGEIYYNNKNFIKARSQWRKTLEIEPSHIGARKRLY